MKPLYGCEMGRGQMRTLVGNGAEGIRTPDLVSAIHALSQLSYSPIYIFKDTRIKRFCQGVRAKNCIFPCQNGRFVLNY